MYYGPDLKVECPTGSGEYLNLAQCAQEIQHRLIHLFLPDEEGNRACNGGDELVNKDPFFKDYVPFYEYFDGDTGRGLGASHQCGWTAVVAKWIHDNGVTCRIPKTPRTPVNRRNSSVFLHDSASTDEDVKKYRPKSGPFSGKLVRRKSGKSLLNLTVNALDLNDDEEEATAKAAVCTQLDGLDHGVCVTDEILKKELTELQKLNLVPQLIQVMKLMMNFWNRSKQLSRSINRELMMMIMFLEMSLKLDFMINKAY